MQRVESYGLMGTAPETVAPLSTATAVAIVAAAERIAPAADNKLSPNAPKRKRPGPSRKLRDDRATGGLIKRISAAEAARDDLPDGVYVFPNGRGQTASRCVGEANCRAYTAAMRVRALTRRGSSDQLAEEIASLIRRGA